MTAVPLPQFLLLAVCVAVAAVGALLAIRAVVDRGDVYLPCNDHRNRMVTVRLWTGAVLALAGLTAVMVVLFTW